jgi:aminocarboxymuconate-semialdehyde decarboxylase
MGHSIFPECKSAIPRPPSSYIEQFSFDTISFNRSMLRYLADTYGAERLVIGTDYPLPAGPAQPVAEVKALGLSPTAEAAILGENASRLLRLT